jgi:hypothetical protein
MDCDNGLDVDCEKSLELLGEFQAGGLADIEVIHVRTHLEICIGCHDVLRDLETIVRAAELVRDDDGISFPDEDAIWARMSLGLKIIH